MRRGPSGSWLKLGCMATAGLAVIVLVVLGVAVGIAVRQNRDTTFESRSFVPDIPRVATGEDATRPTRLDLRVHTAGVTVRPVAAGEPLRIEADYDPRRHELTHRTERDGETVVMTVDLRPRDSTLMALLRVKLGGRPAVLRIALPRDLPLEIEGLVQRSYAAMELGGLSLASARLRVRDGGAKVSFIEPLATPMETLSLSGSRSSLSVVGLGNANPSETRVLQHIGAVDLDLRGAWRRDASVRVLSGAAGGSLWLPDNARIIGLGDGRSRRVEANPELPLPTIELRVDDHMGRFVVLD